MNIPIHNSDMLELRFSQRWPWKALSSRMWHSVVWYKCTDVSEERTASIFKVKRKPSNEQKVCSSYSLLTGRLLGLPWRWKQYGPLKHQKTSPRLHSVTAPEAGSTLQHLSNCFRLIWRVLIKINLKRCELPNNLINYMDFSPSCKPSGSSINPLKPSG
jgi:hypothetical protein